MKNKLLAGLIGGFVMLVVGFGYFAYANPLFFPKGANTAGSNVANASTTRSYMTPGTGTTTLVHDAFDVDPTLSSDSTNPTGLDTLALAVHMTATTGVMTLNIACEYSRDGIDYYEGNCYDTSTTTNVANITGEMSSYTWVFASSTCSVGGAAPSATQDSCRRIFEVNPLSRYV